MVGTEDVFGINDVLSGDITVQNPSFVGKFQVSFGTWATDSSLDCTSFLCTLIIANGVFSFIFSYSVEEDGGTISR